MIAVAARPGYGTCPGACAGAVVIIRLRGKGSQREDGRRLDRCGSVVHICGRNALFGEEGPVVCLPLTVLLCALPAAPAETPKATANLDLAAGTLAGWEGEGFFVAPAPGGGPRLGFGVCSADRDKVGQTGVL